MPKSLMQTKQYKQTSWIDKFMPPSWQTWMVYTILMPPSCMRRTEYIIENRKYIQCSCRFLKVYDIMQKDFNKCIKIFKNIKNFLLYAEYTTGSFCRKTFTH